MSLVLVLDADCFLEKAGLVGAVGSSSSIFLGIFIITKSLSNLLLVMVMSCTKLLDNWIREVTFGGDEVSKSSNQKILGCNQVTRDEVGPGPMFHHAKQKISNRFMSHYWKVRLCFP